MKKLLLFTILLSYLLFPLKVQAATASFFTSGGGSVYPSTNINVTVSANGSEAYNAVEVSVNFSNLTYLGVSVASGWTGVSGPTRSGNTVTFSGALLGSTATGSRAVLNFSFRAPASTGSAAISASGQIALANGQGTKVSGGGNTVTYSIIAAPAPPPPPPDALTVTSTTHPDQAVWYKDKTANLSWNKESGVNVFSYILDNIPETIPDDAHETDTTELTLNDLHEGPNYFHIKAHNDVGWGGATHYRISIDTEKPDPFTITILEDPDDDDMYILYFATDDLTSGVSHFNVEVDDGDLGRQESGYKISKLAKKVFVTAFDHAGNSISDEFKIASDDLTPIDGVIQKETPAFVFDLPTASVTLGGVVVVGTIASGSYFLSKRMRSRQVKTPVVSS